MALISGEEVKRPKGSTCSIVWTNEHRPAHDDSFLLYYAAFADDDAEPIGTEWVFGDADEAIDFAEKLCSTFKLAECLIEID